MLGSRGTSSQFVLYGPKNMCAKFDAFTRFVTIFPLTDRTECYKFKVCGDIPLKKQQQKQQQQQQYSSGIILVAVAVILEVPPGLWARIAPLT